MSVIAAAELLTRWEQARRLSPAGRAQTLLRTTVLGEAAIERLSVGQRDALLMEMRGAVFGSRIVSVASCPACSERVEVNFDLAEVRAQPPGDPAAPFELEAGGYTIVARAVTAGDVAMLDSCSRLADRRDLLMRRCVLDARRGKRKVAVERIPTEMVTRLVARLAEADPQADIQLALACPACGQAWSAVFDIVSFFWSEIDSWAHRLLREIHALASAYGWRETDILALSAERRALYLNMVRA